MATISRREFVRDAGGLLIGFSLVDPAVVPRLLAQGQTVTSGSTPSPSRLDAWLKVQHDGAIRIFTGKVEIGMGVDTAYTQFVADELDIAPERVAFVMGDTSTTTDQGGVGGSTSISLGSRPLRNVAAAARGVLLRLASARLGAPVD